LIRDRINQCGSAALVLNHILFITFLVFLDLFKVGIYTVYTRRFFPSHVVAGGEGIKSKKNGKDKFVIKDKNK
jgi:hypothetical protein